MTMHFQKEIERLKKKILSLSAMVEQQVYQAVKSVVERDQPLADAVIAKDVEIDEREVEIEEDCLKVLALHQPVAIDLRFLIAVLKINSDLERIGDLAVNISGRARSLMKQTEVEMLFDIEMMGELVQSMLKKSLDSLINMDAALAGEVGADDDKIDELHRLSYEAIRKNLPDRPNNVGPYLHMLAVSRHLERIADHATNIAEDVIYMIKGEIVRHQGPRE